MCWSFWSPTLELVPDVPTLVVLDVLSSGGLTSFPLIWAELLSH